VTDPLRFLRKDFDQLEAYKPVLPLEELANEIGVPVEQLVKLDANENLYGPSPSVREAIACADLHIYPDPGSTALRKALGEYLDVSPETIVAGSGSDDLIDVLIRLIMPGSVVTTPPTFGMYGFLAKIAGVRIVEAPRNTDYSLDLDAVSSSVDAGASLVFVASPNNPTGNAASTAEIEALCEMDAVVAVDEAYAEFSKTSAVGLVERFPNLVVLRTFSKWAGLAGLRVGYAVADPRLAERMMAIKQPYNVNVAADVAARAALAHRGEILETVAMLVAERQRMVAELARFDWLKPYRSDANFVLFRVVGRSAFELAMALRRKGVLVRYYDRPDLHQCVRISAGRPHDTDRLVAALQEVAQT
jgi:histidinol-phosphate aminotransferase